MRRCQIPHKNYVILRLYRSNECYTLFWNAQIISYNSINFLHPHHHDKRQQEKISNSTQK